MSTLPDRDGLLNLSDDALLNHCRMEHFIASGSGGQKRNKTSNAVRLTLDDTGITASASDDRQQSVNKLHALRKLRLAIAFEMRLDPEPWKGQWNMNPKNSQYPQFAACLTDYLSHHNWQVSEAAKALDLSTGKLIKIIAKDDSFWQLVNTERQKLGFKTLRK